ncbi:bifunctional arginine demethylase and lysyl-hydroxylase JMJD6-like isoform X2 [Watersipora subatra]|uniref:bifunctional arginine demethylase and lysyl-hydroxylase JMJD6-like isoform X2 n=1 Tax=Watersipora subatra TaxID=2589382 RepID=UPI00355C4770
MERKTSIRIKEAKEKARPELCKEGIDAGWRKFGFAKNFSPSASDVRETIERLDGNKINAKLFIKQYESNYIPCIITNLMNDWPATETWTLQKLARKYRNQKFKCGEDDDGYSVKLKMKYFVRYMADNKDDSPLYIFDSSFSDHMKRKRLLDDFQVPRVFPDDYFNLVGESRRPPYRWFVMGPARSGTGIHIDPLGTSAWNSLITGHKRWCLFPPETPKELLKPSHGDAWKQKGEAITWFAYVYPKVSAPDWPEKYKMIECVQGPGETMFVPGGWWHVVLNLDDTIAVTQNYCGRVNFPVVWKKTVKGRPKLSKKWLRAMQLRRSDLSHIAESVDLNEENGYASSSSSSSSSSSDSSLDSDSDSECQNETKGAGEPGSPKTSTDEDYRSVSSSPDSAK